MRRRSGAVLGPPLARLAVVLVLAVLASGYTWGPYLVPISKDKLKGVRGVMTIYPASPAPGADTLGAAVLLFGGGMRLRAEGGPIGPGRDTAGTLDSILKKLHEPWKYVLYEVRERNERLMGYLLVHDELMDAFNINEKNQSIYIVREKGFGGD